MLALAQARMHSHHGGDRKPCGSRCLHPAEHQPTTKPEATHGPSSQRAKTFSNLIHLSSSSLLHSTLAQTIATKLHTEDRRLHLQTLREKVPGHASHEVTRKRAPLKRSSPLLPSAAIPASSPAPAVRTPHPPHHPPSLQASARGCWSCLEEVVRDYMRVVGVALREGIRGSFRRCRMVMRLPC